MHRALIIGLPMTIFLIAFLVINNLHPRHDSQLYPAWSPDGIRIAFASNRHGNYDIYTVKRDGTVLQRMTQDSGDNQHPHWSPDGKSIVFCSDRTGNMEIYRMNANGTNPCRRYSSRMVPRWHDHRL